MGEARGTDLERVQGWVEWRGQDGRRKERLVRHLGVIELTARDREICKYVVRYGAATVAQIARATVAVDQDGEDRRALFGSVWAAYRRVRALDDVPLKHARESKARRRHAALLKRQRWLWRQPEIIRVTAAGARFADVGLSPARLERSQADHTLALVDLSESLLGAHPGARWVTERELRRDRLQAMNARADDGKFRASSRSLRTPDGVLVLRDGRRLAIELDLTAKRTVAYEAIVTPYAGEFGFVEVWWYVPSPTAEHRLQEVLRQTQMSHLIKVRVLKHPHAA